MKALAWWDRFRGTDAWADGLDFAGPRARTAWWAWLVLGLGAALALKVSDEFDRLRLAHEEGEMQLKRLGRAERQVRLAQALSMQAESATDTGLAPPLSGPALTEAVGMGLLLAYPWGQVLGQLERQAASHQAVMLGMSVDLAGLADAGRAQPLWRLQAAVQGDADAMAWASALPQGRLLTRERLTQPFTGLNGAYEFKVQVQMTPTAPVMQMNAALKS